MTNNQELIIKNPQHVAIIMDGNRRWAKNKGLPVAMGHHYGLDAMEALADAFKKYGFKAITVYAFSTENWRRSKDEVRCLMRLLKIALKDRVKKLHKKNIKLMVSGKIADFSLDLQKTIHQALELTKHNTGGILNIALNYGGREEIISAIKKIVKDKKEKIENLTAEIFSKYLYTADLPDPDLLIRTSGEQRLSNFLPWQMAYTELYFCQKNWPDFDMIEMEKAVNEYKQRKRNFGK